MSSQKKQYKNFTMRCIKKNLISIDRLVGQPGWRQDDIKMLLGFLRKMVARVEQASVELDRLIKQNEQHKTEVQNHVNGTY